MGTLAIKNPKDISPVLKTSAFFRSGSVFITRGIGRTYRRNHQGENPWYLYNISPVYKPLDGKTPINFGTYCGVENYVPGIFKESLEPITQSEWEKAHNRAWNYAKEFEWFKGTIEPFGIVALYQKPHWVKETKISKLPCYDNEDTIISSDNADSAIVNDVVLGVDGSWLGVRTWFKNEDDAQKQLIALCNVGGWKNGFIAKVPRSINKALTGKVRTWSVYESDPYYKTDSYLIRKLIDPVPTGPEVDSEFMEKQNPVPDGIYRVSDDGIHRYGYTVVYICQYNKVIQCIVKHGAWERPGRVIVVKNNKITTQDR